MKFKAIAFLILTNLFLNAQEKKIRVKDFNGDGKKDTLKYYYDGGSGFGGIYYELTNGKTNEKFELDTWGCFCQCRKMILIPPALRKKENKAFLDTLKNAMLPKKQESPDPTLQWIINGTLSSHTVSGKSYYSQVFTSPLKWISAEIKLPDHYYIELKGKELDRLYFTDSEKPEWYDKENNEGWLIYNAHYSGIRRGKSIVKVDSSGIYSVYKSEHAVLLKKENSYAWIFITDYNLTGAPEKLRWPSIKTVKMFGNFVMVLQELPPGNETNIFVIDVENGTVGQLNTNGHAVFALEKDYLLMTNGILTESKIPVKNLFLELRSLKK